MLNLVNHSRGGSEKNSMMDIFESGLQAIMREALQHEDSDADNDSNDGDEVVSMQMVNQHQATETTEASNQREPGTTALQQKPKNLPRLPSSHIKIPPNAKKQRKKMY